ncbi:MAG: TRAP transporter substrate-binding protein DctP [Alphaproteobacteria bacterium]|nr:TRAP transporter substrate-binding protein DctP [Alphaproteobacteria bacterium]
MKLNRSTLILTGAVLAAGLSAAPASSQEVLLRAASCFPIGSPPSRPFEAYVKDVNKQGKGFIQIKLLGGAPAIGSPFTMTRNMSRGTYDIIGCPDAYFGNVLPESEALRLSDYKPSEMRVNGSYAYMRKLFARKNIHFVARHMSFGPFYLFTSRPLTKPDLKGWHLRVSPVYTPFFKSLGATVQRSNISQVYTYMENGTVQGYGWPALGWVPSWIKVSKYRIEPGFYVATLQILVNLKKWKTLSPRQQDIITQIALAYERRGENWDARLAKSKAWMASKGMKTIKFTGADAAKWSKAAKDAGWARVKRRSPRHGRVLERMMRKN